LDATEERARERVGYTTVNAVGRRGDLGSLCRATPQPFHPPGSTRSRLLD